MAFEIWIDSPAANSSFAIAPGNMTYPITVTGHYIDDDNKNPVPVNVVISNGGTPISGQAMSVPQDPPDGYVHWKVSLDVPQGQDYTITATLTDATYGTTSDSHEHIDVIAGPLPITFSTPDKAVRLQAARGGATIHTVGMDVGDTSGKGTWVVCTLRKGPNPNNPKPKKPKDKPDPPKCDCHAHHQDYRIIAVQALRVTGCHLTATFTIPKPYPKECSILVQAVLLDDAGLALGQAVQNYGSFPT